MLTSIFTGVHFQVKICVPELHFFCKDENYKKGLDWYRNQMPLSEPHQLTVEKTPNYFTSEIAMQRIQQMNSSIKIIIVVREPVSRMVSDYVHNHSLHPERRPEKHFGTIATVAPTGEVDERCRELQPSLYDVHFTKWLKYFNRSQILLVDGDTLVRDPVTELVRVERFLGLQHQFDETMFYMGKQGFYCLKNTKVKHECMSWDKGQPHPKVQKDVWDKLCKYFEPHNRDFFKMSGQYFDWKC